jgi:hypothetical protein
MLLKTQSTGQPAAGDAKRAPVLLVGPGLLLALGLLWLAFFAFWNWDLGYPSLSGDESFVAIMDEQPVSYLFQRLNSDEPHPPLYYLLRRGWHVLIGSHEEFVERYPSVLIGMLLLSLTYRLGRDLGLRPGASAAVAIAVGLNPQITVHVREARMYGLMLAALTAAAVVAWRFERLPSRFAIGLAAGIGLLALLTHYFNSLFVVALGLWGVLTFRGPARRRWVTAQAITWTAFAMWLPLFGRGFFNPTSLAQGKTWSLTLPPWQTLARLAVVGTFGYRDQPAAWLTVAGGVLLAGAWLWGSLLAPPKQRRLLLVGVVAPLGVYALLAWFKPLFHPKYTLPWLVYAAAALGFLIMRRPRLGIGLWVALMAIMFLPTWNTVRRPYDPGLDMQPGDGLTRTPRDLSGALAALAGPSDLFAMGTPDAAHCYYSEYYFGRSLGCALIPEYPTQTADAAAAQVEALLAQHAVLWYLDFYNPAWDPQRVADQAFNQRALSLGTEELAGRTLRLYTSADSVRQHARHAGQRFGEAAQLQGLWTLRGQALHVVLIWRALAERPALNAKVFVHLLDADGLLLAQDDSIPVSWTRPLGTWQLGEQLLDIHSLLPPAGTPAEGLSLRLGLYDPETLARLPAYDANGVRLPDDYVVMPVGP